MANICSSVGSLLSLSRDTSYGPLNFLLMSIYR
jgi:hypothetical protein